jgi:hypothetical protein
VLTGRGQKLPDEPIRVRAEIFFLTVSQRTNFDNSDGVGDLSASQTERRRVNCFFAFSRGRRWRTISRRDDAFLELNPWIRSYKDDKEIFLPSADEDLNYRGVQIVETTKSIFLSNFALDKK